MRRLLVGALLLLTALIALNTVVTDSETKSAKADIGQVLDLPEGDLQVREDGPRDAPAIVMLHGFASSMHWWAPTAKRLARDFRLIRIDLLGHGGSEKPDEGYAIEHQARQVALALSALRVQHAVIAGHSMGGIVATALTELDPSLVDGVALVDTPPNKDAGELPFLARLGFVPVVGETIRRLVTDGMVRDNLESAFAGDFHVPDQFVEDFRRMTYTSFDSSHDRSGDYNEDRPVSERLAAVRKPLLVVFGAQDELVDPDSAREFEAVPGARIELLPATGHTPIVERPAETARLISEFVRRVSSGPADRAPDSR